MSVKDSALAFWAKVTEIAKAPVVVAKLVGAVATIALAFGLNIDVEQVLAVIAALGALGLFEYRRVTPVPKDDRGFGAVAENTSHLDRLIAELEAEVVHD